MRARHATLLFAVSALALSGAGDGAANLTDKEALAQLQVYVGNWRGVGQPRRGSTAGAWTEQAEWAWQFSKSGAAIAFKSPEGKFFSGGQIVPGDGADRFRLIATLPDSQAEEHYAGSLEEGRLVFDAEQPDKRQPDKGPPSEGQAAEGRPARITIRTVADGDRLLVLFESRRAGTDIYTRLAEVGYTRKGSSFGKGTSGPECVVTGGYGSIAVDYKGKTYYVCCTGCRDLFNDDPEGVLAEYRERKAKEREEKPE